MTTALSTATSATSLDLYDRETALPEMEGGKPLNSDTASISSTASMRPHHCLYGAGPKPGIRNYQVSQFIANAERPASPGRKPGNPGIKTPLSSILIIKSLDTALCNGDANAIHNAMHALQSAGAPLFEGNVLWIASGLKAAFGGGHDAAIDAILPWLADARRSTAYGMILDAVVQSMDRIEFPRAAGAMKNLGKLLDNVPASVTNRILINAAGCLRKAFVMNDSGTIAAFTNLVDKHCLTWDKKQRARMLDAILRQQRTSSGFNPGKSSSYKTWRNAERDAMTLIHANYRAMKLSLRV